MGQRPPPAQVRLQGYHTLTATNFPDCLQRVMDVNEHVHVVPLGGSERVGQSLASFTCRVLFFSAKPKDERAFDSLRREAAAEGDIVVLPTIWESYFNITHQTLEVLRTAATDVAATHVLKVCPEIGAGALPIRFNVSQWRSSRSV